MSQLETIKANLKQLASDSLDLALKELERLLSPQSPLFNSFLLLKGQFKKCREEFLLGILSQEQSTQTYARLMSAFLQFTSDLSNSDLIPEKETAQKPAEKRGELLYHVPHTMQVMREEKCTVRIAWTEAALFENWKHRKDDIHRHNLRIAEIMGVELMSLSEDALFSIKSLHSTVQFLDEEEYTEWIFYVKPLRAGDYPLVIRISVIEMRDNREVKRELVLEEQINVSTEVPQVEAGQEDMVRVPMAYFAAGAPFVEVPAFKSEVLRRYGALLVMMLFCAAAWFVPWGQNKDDFFVVSTDTNDTVLNPSHADNLSEFAQLDTGQSIQNNPENHYTQLSEKEQESNVSVERKRQKLRQEQRSRAKVSPGYQQYMTYEEAKAEDRRLLLIEMARLDKVKTSGPGTPGAGSAISNNSPQIDTNGIYVSIDTSGKIRKMGNQGIPGGTGNNPFGQSPGSGGGTGDGAGTGTGSSVGGSLGGRKMISIRKPIVSDTLQKQGTVRVKICVNSEGQVISAEPTQTGSTTTDGGLRLAATTAARQFRFAPEPGTDTQCGWIDFNFRLK